MARGKYLIPLFQGLQTRHPQTASVCSSKPKLNSGCFREKGKTSRLSLPLTIYLYFSASHSNMGGRLGSYLLNSLIRVPDECGGGSVVQW